MTCLNKTYFCS